MWTFLQNHKQLRLNLSQTDSCPAQHIMESSQRLQVPVPDQAIKTPQLEKHSVTISFFWHQNQRKAQDHLPHEQLEQVNVAAFEFPNQSLTTFWTHPNTCESVAGRVTFSKAYFAGTADLLKQTFCQNALFVLKYFKPWNGISGWNQQDKGAGLRAQQCGETGRARI